MRNDGKRLTPLVQHQFRFLKWVTLVNTAIALLSAWLYANTQRDVADRLWTYGLMTEYTWKALSDIFFSPVMCAVTFIGLTVVFMAFVQQGSAYNPRGAKFMTSLPYTQNEHLKAMVISGMLCYTLPLILFGVVSLGIYSSRPDIIEAAIKVSEIQHGLMAQNTPVLIVVSVFKGWLAITASYAIVLLVSHMFGNIIVSVGSVCALCFWGIIGMDIIVRNSYMVDNIFGFQGYGLIRKMEDILLPLIPRSLYIGDIRSDMPWNGLLISMLLYGGIAAACFAGCTAARRKLHIENLGSVFLFKASRYIIVGYITLWACLPFIVSLYNRDGGGVIISIIPPALVLLVSRWLLTRKKRRRRKHSKVIAGMLVMILCCGFGMHGVVIAEPFIPAQVPAPTVVATPLPQISPAAPQQPVPMVAFELAPMATAEPFAQTVQERYARVQAQIAPERLYFDISLANQALELMWTLDEYQLIPYRDSEVAYENGTYTRDTLSALSNKVSAGGRLTYDEWIFVRSMFQNSFLTVSLQIKGEESQKFIRKLEEMGYSSLAQAVQIIIQTGEWGYNTGYYENGLWMSVERDYWQQESNWDNDWQKETIRVISIDFYMDIPIMLMEHKEVFSNLKGSQYLCRSVVFSNGEYDMVQYRLIDSRVDWQDYTNAVLQLIFRGEKFEQLFVQFNDFYIDDPQNLNITNVVLSAVLTDIIPMSDSDAERIAVRVHECWTKNRSGSGTVGNITWRFDKIGGVFNNRGYRLHIEAR